VERPRVSVIVPAYNVAPYVEACLDSVLAQTYRDYEIVVVDDGSTDDTPQILRRYGGVIRCIPPEKGGARAARDGAIRKARGEPGAVLGADDAWRASYLERQVTLVDRLKGPALVYADAYLWDGRTPPSELTETWIHSGPQSEPGWTDAMHLMVWQFALPSATVVSRSALLGAGLFDEALPTSNDLDLWVRLARRGVRFVCNPEPLVLYRFRRPGSLTSSILANRIGYAQVLRKILTDRELGTAERVFAARLLASLAAGLRGEAIRSLRAGNFSQARACLQASLEIEPTHRRARTALVLTRWPSPARLILSAVYWLLERMP